MIEKQHDNKTSSVDINNNKCCSSESGTISKVYLLAPNDIIVENGVIRIKRKYGKFKRIVSVINYK